MPDWSIAAVLAAGACVTLLRLFPRLRELLLGTSESKTPDWTLEQPLATRRRTPQGGLEPEILPEKLLQRPGVRLLLQALVALAALTPNRLDDLAAAWARRIIQAAEGPSDAEPPSGHNEP